MVPKSPTTQMQRITAKRAQTFYWSSPQCARVQQMSTAMAVAGASWHAFVGTAHAQARSHRSALVASDLEQGRASIEQRNTCQTHFCGRERHGHRVAAARQRKKEDATARSDNASSLYC
eukprot:6207067-Pleurochrysis_carterae.AAC.1